MIQVLNDFFIWNISLWKLYCGSPGRGKLDIPSSRIADVLLQAQSHNNVTSLPLKLGSGPRWERTQTLSQWCYGRVLETERCYFSLNILGTGHSWFYTELWFPQKLDAFYENKYVQSKSQHPTKQQAKKSLAHIEVFNLPPVESLSAHIWCSINPQLIWTQAASVAVGQAQTFPYSSGDQMFWWLKPGLREQLHNTQRGVIPRDRFPSQSRFENLLLLSSLFKLRSALLSHHYGWCNSLSICVVNQVFYIACIKKRNHCFAVEGVLTQVLLAVQYIGYYLKRSHKHSKAAINNSTRV